MIPSDFRDFFISSDALMQQEIVSSLLSLSLKESEVSNSHRSYGAFAKSNTITHKKFNVSKGQRTVDKVYHVQNVNNMDMRLRKLMESFNGVATKYLQNYLNWFLVLEKIKNSTSKMATVTAIAFASK